MWADFNCWDSWIRVGDQQSLGVALTFIFIIFYTFNFFYTLLYYSKWMISKVKGNEWKLTKINVNVRNVGLSLLPFVLASNSNFHFVFFVYISNYYSFIFVLPFSFLTTSSIKKETYIISKTKARSSSILWYSVLLFRCHLCLSGNPIIIFLLQILFLNMDLPPGPQP